MGVRFPSQQSYDILTIQNYAQLLKPSWRNKMVAIRVILTVAATATLANVATAFQSPSLPMSLRAGARSPFFAIMMLWFVSGVCGGPTDKNIF